MTITQILADLLPHKPMTQTTLYSYLRRFKIKPVSGIRQCPQRYPEDTPARILKKLGIGMKSKR